MGGNCGRSGFGCSFSTFGGSGRTIGGGGGVAGITGGVRVTAGGGEGGAGTGARGVRRAALNSLLALPGFGARCVRMLGGSINGVTRWTTSGCAVGRGAEGITASIAIRTACAMTETTPASRRGARPVTSPKSGRRCSSASAGGEPTVSIQLPGIARRSQRALQFYQGSRALPGDFDAPPARTISAESARSSLARPCSANGSSKVP